MILLENMANWPIAVVIFGAFCVLGENYIFPVVNFVLISILCVFQATKLKVCILKMI